jgi:hypothetical protein
MEFAMDISLSGLEMFFRDYQIEAFQTLWEEAEGLFSKDVWIRVNQRRERPISRASIINFLNDMLRMGLLEGVKETGKGGYRMRYIAKMSEQELKKHLITQVKLKLETLF